MPTYTFKNTKTGEVKEDFMKIAEMEQLVKEGEWRTMIGSPSLVTHTGSIVGRTSTNYRDLLSRIHKGAGKQSKIKL
jgi:hypothetical protein|tara:strand:+ start:8166 stop:8396 length:231 start_codon:yes stop_codon:yes gene_type:complete